MQIGAELLRWCRLGATGLARQMLPSDDWRAVSRTLHRFSTGCGLYQQVVYKAVCVLPLLIAVLGYHTAKPMTEIV